MSTLAAPCWRAEDADQILSIEALTGDASVFLATHTPVRGFTVGGSRGSQIDPASEETLLDVLSAEDRRHAFCVVQGEPGSGKSHIIRWLNMRWPEGDDVRLLIQRADGSLTGTLQQLKSRLGEFEHLFASLGSPQTATLTGRAADFASRLGNMLRPDYLDIPLEDAAWCETHGVGALIRSTSIADHWQAPLRILQLMDGGAERQSEDASFNLGDLVELTKHLPSRYDTGAAEKLAQKLLIETRVIENLVADGCPYDLMQEVAGNQLPFSLKVLDALNRRRNDAVRSVIGITTEGLKTLFVDLRRALHERGKRLVLLLEDITSWQGVDDALIDVLVTDATTREDVCPLISVVGVTPHYYNKDLQQGNYRDRITHLVRLDLESDQSSFAAALRSTEDRLHFAARYLSAVRTGSKRLRDWYKNKPHLDAPNPCTGCEKRDACHAAFGDVDGVGLFPFNARAIENLFESLTDSGVQNHKTPRGFLQGVLSPTLLSPQILTQTAYPGAQIEPASIVRRDLMGYLRNVVAQATDVPQEHERLRRLFAYWGDMRPHTTIDQQGGLAFAGVSRAISDAFGLPWLGEASPSTTAGSTSIAAPFAPSPTAAQQAEPPSTNAARPVRAAPEAAAPSPLQRALNRRRPAVKKSDREKLRQSVAAFRKDGDIENINTWNKLLHEGVDALEPRELGVDPFVFDKLFTAENVMLEGTGQAKRQSYFVVPRAPWVVDGLEALLGRDTMHELVDVELYDYRQKLATFLRRLKTLAKAHVARRLAIPDKTEPWSPAAGAVQVLLARAWLRGAASADQSTAQQWCDLLRDETLADTAPASRVKAWSDLLDRTKNKHERIRVALRAMVASPQGETSRTWGLADVSVVAAALIATQKRLAVAAAPDAAFDQQDLEAVRSAQIDLDAAIHTLPRREREMMSNRAAELNQALRKKTLRDHVARLRRIITDVSQHLPDREAALVAAWQANAAKFDELIPEVRARDVEDLIVALEGDAISSPSADLSWLAKAPAKELETSWRTVKDGEALVERLLAHMDDLMEKTRNAPDLSSLRAHGRAFEAAVKTARTRFEGGPT